MHVPSRNTGRGVQGCGEPKGKKPVSIGKPISAQPPQGGEAQGLKGPEVTVLKLETRRSIPGQGEARRKPSGGSKGF